MWWISRIVIYQVYIHYFVYGRLVMHVRCVYGIFNERRHGAGRCVLWNIQHAYSWWSNWSWLFITRFSPSCQLPHCKRSVWCLHRAQSTSCNCNGRQHNSRQTVNVFLHTVNCKIMMLPSWCIHFKLPCQNCVRLAAFWTCSSTANFCTSWLPLQVFCFE